MALSPTVLNNRRFMAAAVSWVFMALLGVLAVKHTHFVLTHHHYAPVQELAQAAVVSEVEGFSMPPLPNLPLEKEGRESEGYLRTTLGKLGEDQNPSPANQGLKDLNARIVAKTGGVPLMPPSPRMPPANTQRKSKKETKKDHEDHLKDRIDANQAGNEAVNHPPSGDEVDRAEKVIAREMDPFKMPPHKAMPPLRKHHKGKVLDPAKVKTGTATTVTTVPHTNQDPTCCTQYNSKGGPVFVVRKDKCDLAKACHSKCQHAGHSCFCCKQH